MCVLSEKHAKALHSHASAPVVNHFLSAILLLSGSNRSTHRGKEKGDGHLTASPASFVRRSSFLFFMTPQVVHGSVMRSDVMATAANGADAVGSLPVEVVSQRLQTLLEVIGRSWCTAILKA